MLKIKPKTVRKTAKPIKSKKAEKAPALKTEGYFAATGKRKTAVARVRLFNKEGEKEFLVNDKFFKDYFPTIELQQIIVSPLERMDCLGQFGVKIKVNGGGLHAQAEAVRHGIARALLLFSPDFRKRLKSAGFLTRDARMRERKKFGLKRARKAPQWAKR